jgi:hypothetical protein
LAVVGLVLATAARDGSGRTAMALLQVHVSKIYDSIRNAKGMIIHYAATTP